MAKAGVKKNTNRSLHSKKQQQVLKALDAAAKKVGLKVSAGQLRFAGLRLKGGSCFLRGRQWLILDKNQPFDDLLDIYRQALSIELLEEHGVTDETLDLLAPFLPVSPVREHMNEEAA